MADSEIQGEAGRFTQNQRATLYAQMTGTGSLRMAQCEPVGTEASRAGLRFYMGQSAALTGIAPVQAMPTTAAQWVIWNTSLTKSLVFESIGMYLTAGVAGVGTTVVGSIITLPATTTTKAGITIASASGSTATTVALINSGVTVTSPAAPAWQVIVRDDSANTVALNVLAIDRAVSGRIVVPPLKGLGLCAIAPTGTSPLYAPIASWLEMAIDLE